MTWQSNTALLILAICLGSTPAAAAPPAPPAPAASPPAVGCPKAENRQFDFWVGKWEVYDRLNRTTGKSLIESIYGGCGLRESWSETGLVGGSINAYSTADQKWHQLWVDSSGGIREFVGGLDDHGAMVLIARYPSARFAGRIVWDRMTFSRLPDGTVRQYSDASLDEGASWKPLDDNIYTRAE